MIKQVDEAFQEQLLAAVRGEVSFDTWTRGVYATDAGNYQIMPLAVVCPQDADDVIAAVKTAARFAVPILPRGAGTSLAGQTVGEAMVLDVSRHMDQVLEINLEEGWARVQPGVVRDTLNAKLAGHGLQFAPDPATSNRANIGGMIANNASGTRSILYGKTIDHVLEMDVLLADGTRLFIGPLTPEAAAQKQKSNNREGDVYREVRRLVDENMKEIQARFPKVMRRVGGYNLDALAQTLTQTEYLDLAKLICGSEGTLAVILEARIKLVPLPAHTALCLPQFHVFREALEAVQRIVQEGPSAVEILDHYMFERARENLEIAPYCSFLEGEPKAVLMVEFSGSTADEVRHKADALAKLLERDHLGYTAPVRTDPAEIAEVWALRKHGLGLLLGVKTERKPLPCIEDAAVPLEVLPDYIDEVREVCREQQIDVTMYAHASVGLIHVRPILDLRRSDDIEAYRTISQKTFELVKKYGGSWSGEHGDGLLRSAYNEAFFGEKLYRVFQDIKKLFDPYGLMNPGKIVQAPPITEHLRFGSEYQTPSFKTSFHFRADGGFAEAVHLCSGVGACRKLLNGTMCPSYMVTRDEEHSTRGRANALRLAMSGQMGEGGLADPRLYDIFDLCLSCKACKRECPSNVDMARLKGAFLEQYHAAHGTTFRERLIARAPAAAAKICGWKAPLVNRVQASGLFRFWLERTAGFDRQRPLPRYARKSLMNKLAGRSDTRRSDRKVVLFVDTFMNYHEPDVGLAAVELLESCGYEVVPARAGCCQRPRISQGLLQAARKDGEATLKKLDQYIEEGLDVVVCEPSCASALVDDLPDLIDDEALGERIRKHVFMIDVWLAGQVASGACRASFSSTVGRILLHGHCHQKALFRTEAMKTLYRLCDGLDVDEVDSGCCGMAGSFGYEKEHVELSKKMGERRLFPAVRKAENTTTVVACGFSCRHQIRDFTKREAVHWVETLRGEEQS